MRPLMICLQTTKPEQPALQQTYYNLLFHILIDMIEAQINPYNLQNTATVLV